MHRAKPSQNAKRILERLRSSESASAIAAQLKVRDAQVQIARDLLRHIGEHQAASAGQLPDPLAQAVVEAAVQVEHADFLKAIAEKGAKAATSAAKRGLAILRSRGIDIELSPTGQPLVKQQSLPQEELFCLATSEDARGERALWIPQPVRGGLQLTVVLVSDVEGIMGVETEESGRKAYRKLKEKYRHDAAADGIIFYEMPLKQAKGIVAAARALSPQGLTIEQEARLANLAGDAQDALPPTQFEPPADPAQEAQYLAESGLLHQEREIASWVPIDGGELLQTLALQVDEISTSSLYIDEQQRQEQKAHLLRQVTQTYFDTARQRLYAQRLFNLAQAFTAISNTQAAQRAKATARALQSGTNPLTIDFCYEMFNKLLVEKESAEKSEPVQPLGLSDEAELIVRP